MHLRIICDHDDKSGDESTVDLGRGPLESLNSYILTSRSVFSYALMFRIQMSLEKCSFTFFGLFFFFS